VVPGHRENRHAKPLEQPSRSLVLIRSPAVCQIARDDHDGRLALCHELAERRPERPVIAGADMQIGDVNEPDWHDRSTLYTQIEMTEPTELFDDLYLGLRAGGAIRKRRRGESLTSEEEAALTRWQRLSQWRKTIAIGAFAVGTFGLGFTLGGIVFSKRGKREAV
jgi:hypothetical protein